jgi:U3 small nucleolar RNA-associated protein 20
LPWGPYYSLLRTYLKLIPRKAEMEKILVRTVIAILDNFHFDIKDVEVSPEEAGALIHKRFHASKTKTDRKKTKGSWFKHLSGRR